MKSAYSIAESLRGAGFIASIQVDNEDKADFRWVIEVNNASPLFVVQNQSNKRKQPVETIVEYYQAPGR
jgi:hypothetical protein